MATKPSSLLRVPVEMPDRSGHNVSHSNSFSGTTGTLIPVLCDELLPNDTVSLGAQLQVQLPPMVTDFYGKVDFVLEAFFVPYRLCWRGWQDFITHDTAYPQYPEGTPTQLKPSTVPFLIKPTSASTDNIPISVDSLAHYLTYGRNFNFSSANPRRYNYSALPLVAYHRIFDDWYRDSRVQAPVFFPPAIGGSANVSSLPYSSGSTTNSIAVNSTLGDGHPLNALRQRNWVKDYFTSCSPLPQAGTGSEVKFDVDSSNNTGAFSISTLRAANSLQKWMERNNLAGYRYSDQIYAQFGIYPSDAIMDRSLYLGRSIQTVYNRSIFNTTPSGLATKGASSQALGEGSLVDSFTASEHGFLIVLASLVPRPIYGLGTERLTQRVKVSDFAFPLLAGMGDQAVLTSELTGSSDDNSVFGYTDLYAEYKFKNDRVHGLLSDGQNLDTYVLQRSFGGTSPEISSDFLSIPRDYLDQVQAAGTSESGYTYWAEIYFPYKKLSTIPAYSQPTLADLKHAHTEYISRGGKRL